MTPSTPRAALLTRGTALIAFLLLGTAGVLFLPDWLTRLDRCRARVAELETQLASAASTSPQLAAAREQVRAAAERAAKARQELAAARTELAALHLRVGQPGRAREIADLAVRAHESAPLPAAEAARAYLLRGLARLEEGDRQGGDADVTKAHGLAATPESFYGLARNARANGDLREAERYLWEAQRKEPENPAFLCERAVLDRAQGQLGAALRSLDTVLKKVPDHAEAALGRGLIRLARGELNLALADLDRAGGPEARYLRALIAAEQTGPAAYREAFLRGLDLEELEAHIDPLRRYLEKCPRDADASFRLGLLYLAKAQRQSTTSLFGVAVMWPSGAAKSTVELALRELTRALEQPPLPTRRDTNVAAEPTRETKQSAKFTVALLARGIANRLAGNIADAEADFKAVLIADSELLLASLWLGHLCYGADRLTGALERYNEILHGREAAFPAALYRRAMLLRTLGGVENRRQPEQDRMRATALGYVE